MKKTFLLLTASTLLFACNSEKKETVETASANVTLKGVNTSLMDNEVAACTDFYHYCNGTWVRENPVPETEGRWSSFNEVDERNKKILRDILNTSSKEAATAEKGSNIQKIGDLYNLAMDSTKLNADGITPIQSQLDLIDGMTNKDLPVLIAQLNKMGVYPFFSFYVEQDMKNNTEYISYISQGGLGLPDRDFYFKDDEASVSIREAYIEHIDKMAKLAGLGEDFSTPIMKIETALAKASMTNVELRNYEIQYNKMAVEDLRKSSPKFDWNAYLTELGVKIDTIIVSQPEFFKSLNAVAGSSDADLKKYLKWNLLRTSSHYLNEEMEQESFAFYSTKLGGVKKMKPRWKRALRTINGGMGELLGQEYVKIAFSEASKQRLNKLVDNLILAFEARLKTLEWMGEETKKQALKKLSKFNRKLGYPDKWKDYSSLAIENDSYIQNIFRLNKFQFIENIEKLGKPIDKDEWAMSPQTVNAYYHPILNEVVFPAGILQPPFMDPDADDAVLYGTIGAVIGHELTHGFDDQGAGFDADGNLKNWWTEEDMTNFKARAKRVVDKFNAYEPLPELHINGQLTLGENIADLGGLTVAYDAYQMSLKGKERVDIDGFTPEQRFFIAFGQVWKSNYTEEMLRQQINTNPHSPNEYRVLGTLSQMPTFYEAFGCENGDPLFTADSIRAVIW